jgi:hypothetical protein
MSESSSPSRGAVGAISRPRACILVAAVFFATAAACASVADLDVSYGNGSSSGGGGADASEDTRQKVRESLLDASPPIFPPNVIEDGGGGLPCYAEAGLSGEEDGGCDEGAGNGCCLRSNLTAGSVCMSQAEARAQQCSAPNAKGVFVACRQSRGDDVCCWRDLGNGSGGGKGAFYAADCDGGPVACIEDAGCAIFGQACTTKTCAKGGFVIGQCGSNPPSCPEDL